MSGRSIVFALASAVLASAGAGPLKAEQPQPEMALGAKLTGEGDRKGVAVTMRAPLPDGTVVIFGVYRAAAKPGENPLLERRFETKGGTILDELPDSKGLVLPGDYRVTAAVDETQPPELRRRLTPPLRRLHAECVLKVGSRAAVSDSINRLARLILAQSEAIRRVYPEFADLLERAWKKALSRPEWKQWGARPALEKGREQLLSLMNTHGAGAYLPMSLGKAQSLLHEIDVVVTTIDCLLADKITQDRNDNMVRSIKEETSNPGAAAPAAIPSPRIRDLNLTLYREGCAAYAAIAGTMLKDVENAYASRSGKGAGNWYELVVGWAKEIAEQAKCLEEFDKLDFLIDRGDLKVRVLEALALLKDHIELCGRVLKGEAKEEEAQVPQKRGELLQRIDLLKQVMP